MWSDVINMTIIFGALACCGLNATQSIGPTVPPEFFKIPLYESIKMGNIRNPTVISEEKIAQSGQSARQTGMGDNSGVTNVSKVEKEYCFLNLEGVPVVCDENHHCCGYGRMERQCCPNLSAGAIFGIISSMVFISIFFASIVFGCCIWFECTVLVRPKGRKKSSLLSVTQSSAVSQDPDIMETDFGCPDKDRRVSSLKNELQSQEEEQTNFGYSVDTAEANHLLLALPQHNDSIV